MLSIEKIMQQQPILIVGLGNPILGDDGIGWVVADRVRQVLGGHNAQADPFDPARHFLSEHNVEIDRLSLGGLSLMERLEGYERVILVDSITTGNHMPGAVLSFSLSELVDQSGGHTTAPHDTSLLKALDVGRTIGLRLPELGKILVVAVEIESSLNFSENLTPQIVDSIPDAVNAVLSALPIADFA